MLSKKQLSSLSCADVECIVAVMLIDACEKHPLEEEKQSSIISVAMNIRLFFHIL